jgi:aldehyde dehydrogenase (NAD+)
MKKYQLYINGEWRDSSDQSNFNSLNPYTQEVWAQISKASKSDVNEAIESAQNAFHTDWKKWSGLKRAECMNRLAELVEENAHEIAEIDSLDNGKLMKETTKQVAFAARALRFYASYADKLYGEMIPLDNPDMFDYTVREPLGVAVLITSWNSPIQLLSNKLAPALAAGNTVVIKPSEHASASTLEFLKYTEEAGFPKGVINVVTGDGQVGAYLTESDQVNKISFTGGQYAAKQIGKSAANNIVPLTLELGGKSPNIIFEDADLQKAISGAMAGIFASSGQTCIAGSRLFVQRTVYEEVCTKLKERVERIVMGDPMKDETEMGPISNEVQYKNIVKVLETLKDSNSHILTGGFDETIKEPGFFVKPTIVIDVKNSNEIAQNEVFGPILSIIPFDTEEEVIQLANESVYGLASGVWTTNLSRAHRVARQIEAGTVWVNTYRSSAVQAPFGGVKKSGYGRERGMHSLFEYTRVKNVMIDLSDNISDPFSIKTN